jgi:hypothetical protein
MERHVHVRLEESRAAGHRRAKDQGACSRSQHAVFSKRGAEMTQKCKPSQHDDAPLGRGSSRVECGKCGDVFPCRHECIHVDCLIATGRTPPDWIVLR